MVEVKKSVNDAGRQKTLLGNCFTDLLGKSKRLPKVLREIMYGMTVHEMDLELPPLLFNEASALYHPIHRKMEKEPLKGERSD
jgi:hypothetical protein